MNRAMLSFALLFVCLPCCAFAVDHYNVVPQAADAALKAGQYADAIAGYTEAIEEMEAHQQTVAENVFLAKAYVGRGEAYLKLGRLDQATTDLMHVAKSSLFNRGLVGNSNLMELAIKKLAKNPRDLKFLKLQAEVLRDTHEYEKCFAVYKQMLRVAPTDENRSEVLADRAYTYRFMRKYDLAIADLTQAINFAPSSPENYVSRGLTYMSTEDYPKATADFTAAIERTDKSDPSYFSAHFLRGQCEQSAGQLEAARRDLTVAIEGDPTNGRALEERTLVLYEMCKDDLAKADMAELAKRFPLLAGELRKQVVEILKNRNPDKPATSDSLKRRIAANAWEIGSLVVIVPWVHISGREDEKMTKAWERLQKMVASKFADEKDRVDDLPQLKGTQTEQFQQTLDFITQERVKVGNYILAEENAQVADVFDVSFCLHLLSMLNGVGVDNLNANLIKAIRRAGPNSGLPEAIWKPFVDQIEEGNTENLTEAWAVMAKEANAFLFADQASTGK